MKKRQLLVFVLVLGVLSSLFAGGSQEKAKDGQRVVTTVTRSTYASEKWYTDMNNAFTAETGIKVQVEATPGTGDDHVAKVNIDLLAGGTIDVIETIGPREYTSRRDAGFFLPLNAMLQERGIDETKIYGKFIDYLDDGTFHGLPFKQEIFCVFYNKSVFDELGMPYPEAPWTWDDYIRIAQEITTASNGKFYGSLMNLDIPWLYLIAAQRGVPFYKEDGTCNFDHPDFAESLRWYKWLGNDLKIQMSVRQLNAGNVEWNYYATVDNIGMFYQGNWFTRLLNSQEDYPKDWDYGVVSTPTDGTVEGNNYYNSMAYVSVNKNAAHKEEALEYVLWRAENQWKFEGGIPALVNLTAEEQEKVYADTALASGGSITTEELYNALVNDDKNVVSTDILGLVGAEYNNILKEEAELYMLDQQSLDATVKNICDRVNEAIRNL